MTTVVDGPLTEPTGWRRYTSGWAQRWTGIAAGPQWYVIPLVIYAVTRVITSLITFLVMRHQQESSFTPGGVTFSTFSGMWDGFWYRRIATSGYPQPIPSDELGNAHQSEWAFFPAFPMLVRLFSESTGLSFFMTGLLVNLVLGAVLAVLLYDMFSHRVSPFKAAVALSLVLTFPSSPVLQYSYTETLAMLCIVAALRLVQAQAYWSAFVPVALLAITRPVAVPLGLVMLVHLIVRWMKRREDPLTVRQAAGLISLGLFSAASSVGFPVWVGWVNEEFGAYNRVQASWHGGSLGYVIPWYESSVRLLGPLFGPLGLAASAVALGVAVYVGRRVLGVEMATWVVAYVAYLVVVLQPWTSLFRYQLLCFPLALVAAHFVRTRGHWATWAWAMVALQVVWVSWLWHFSPPSDDPP